MHQRLKPEILEKKMKRKRILLLINLAILFVCCFVVAMPTQASDETEVRNVVQQTFEQLRNGDYGNLYDRLPSSSRQRVPREQFINQMQRTRNMYELDRIEINTVRVAGDVAMADTTAYGQIKKPFQGEGKIVMRQYLVREDGAWRVAIEDRANFQRLLANNRDFARRYPPRQPRFYLKRDGRWVDVNELTRRRSR